MSPRVALHGAGYSNRNSSSYGYFRNVALSIWRDSARLEGLSLILVCSVSDYLGVEIKRSQTSVNWRGHRRGLARISPTE